MNPAIAAVVVTYNRSKLLFECLDALLKQTRALRKIVVVDNASTDGTAESFAAGPFATNTSIEYIRLSSNTGGAGGFHAGMKRAYESGAEWIWVMDDDAEPDLGAVEAMLPVLDRPGIAGVASLPFDSEGRPQRSHRGWLALRGLTTTAHHPIDLRDLKEVIEIDFASFVGLAVPRRVIDEIGLPKGELFIKCDDLEYCIRLARLGPIVLVPNSRIVHKEAALVGRPAHQRFGRVSQRIPLERLWLSYFGVRNLVWIRRKYCSPIVAAAFGVRQFVRNAVGIVLYDSDRVVRMRFFYHAIMDGWMGRFDNEKPKQLTTFKRRTAL